MKYPNNITVIGAGTAGWISALFFKEFFPASNVVVIADSNQDIIGVGESTTPLILDLFRFCKIDIDDLIINAGATVKTGIKFTNWNGDNTSFFHGFDVREDLNFTCFDNASPYSKNTFLNYQSSRNFLATSKILNDCNLDDIYLPAILSKENKIPMKITKDEEPWFLNIEQIGDIAIHVDAKKLAHYLQEVATDRGIRFVSDRIVDYTEDHDGYVNSISMKSGKIYNTDFIIDCSGFSRFFAKKMNIPFQSYKDFLPVDQALSFFIDIEENTPPYTEAIAMNYGWMWKIPVEGRFGCGYVYDSKYISESQALKEVEAYLGYRIPEAKTIKFESGFLKQPFYKNILNVGLSSGFIEPLEATSLWLTSHSLILMSNYVDALTHGNDFSRDQYNKEINKFTDNVLSLVYFHYITLRSDNEFWDKFNRTKVPIKTLEKLLHIYNNKLPSPLENEYYNAFSYVSWLLVGAGNKFFKHDVAKKDYEAYNMHSNIGSRDFEFQQYLIKETKDCIDHDYFLKRIRSK